MSSQIKKIETDIKTFLEEDIKDPKYYEELVKKEGEEAAEKKLRSKIKELKILSNYLHSQLDYTADEQPAAMKLAQHVQNELNLENTQLQGIVSSKSDMLSRQMSDIDNKEQLIHDKRMRGDMQKKEIEYKENLITTRDRMLQLSQEKNIYKKKIIYTTLAVIILIVLIMISGYIYFTRK